MRILNRSAAGWVIGLCLVLGGPFSGEVDAGDGQGVSNVGATVVNSGTTNDLAYYASSTASVSPLATANNGTLITSSGGVPSISNYGCTTPAMFGAVGDGIADDTIAMQNAFANGGCIDLAAKTNLINAPLAAANSLEVRGNGVIKIGSGFSGAQAITSASFNNFHDFTIDGSAYVTAGTMVKAIGNASGGSQIRINNMRFNAILGWAVSYPVGVLQLSVTNNQFINMGWGGVQIVDSSGVVVTGNVVNTMATFFIVEGNTINDVVYSDNRINRSGTPSNVYNGTGSCSTPGSQCGGFASLTFSGGKRVIANNDYVGNAGAIANDCIQISENGSTEYIQTVITGNNITGCLGASIDVASNFTVTGNTISGGASPQIFIDLDLGGTIQNAVVANNTVKLSANSQICIQFTSSAATTFKDIIVANNVCDGAGFTTTFGISINQTNNTYTRILLEGNQLFKTVTPIAFIGSGGTPDFSYIGNVTLAAASNQSVAVTPTVTLTGGTGGAANSSCNYGVTSADVKWMKINCVINVTAVGVSNTGFKITIPNSATTNGNDTICPGANISSPTVIVMQATGTVIQSVSLLASLATNFYEFSCTINIQ